MCTSAFNHERLSEAKNSEWWGVKSAGFCTGAPHASVPGPHNCPHARPFPFDAPHSLQHRIILFHAHLTIWHPYLVMSLLPVSFSSSSYLPFLCLLALTHLLVSNATRPTFSCPSLSLLSYLVSRFSFVPLRHALDWSVLYLMYSTKDPPCIYALPVALWIIRVLLCFLFILLFFTSCCCIYNSHTPFLLAKESKNVNVKCWRTMCHKLFILSHSYFEKPRKHLTSK